MTSYLTHREAIREAIDETLYPIEWLDEQVRSGKYRVIGTETACIVVGLKTYPSGVMDIEGIVAAGDLTEIVERLIPAAERLGKSLGCRGALVESRPGWSRSLKAYGYKLEQQRLRKGL